MDYLKTFSIASIAYQTMITDRGLFDVIKRKILLNATTQPFENGNNIENGIKTNKSRRRIRKTTTHFGGQKRKIWETSKKFNDTSSLYRRNRTHMELWSRISSHSAGSLPKEINYITSSEIRSADRDAIKSYTTPSRSVRKCCLTVFAACSKLAGRCIGCFKDSEKHPYCCKSILLSVEDLSKPTHAGTDTLGRKNDEEVKAKVVLQLKDIFRNPTSYKLFFKQQSYIVLQSLENMYNLPELIFHRFQAVYDSSINKCTEKSRIVWCVPYTIVALENIFFGKIIDSAKKFSLNSRKSIYPIGLTNYDIGQKTVGTLRDDFRIIGTSSGYSIYSLDFSKFDTNIPNWAKDLFFSTMSSVMTLKPKENTIFNYLRVYIKHTPFVIGDEIKYKERGISSGLLITNLFDTWWNMTIHIFVDILKRFYRNQIDDFYYEKTSFDKVYLDKEKVKYDFVYPEPLVRVLGDDAIILCDEYTINLHRAVCRMLGMDVKIKHICKDPDDDIFFLGRYWRKDNRPFQTEEHIALRIVYTKWYDKRILPFSIKQLHLFRVLSICLPFVNGKEFLDKYLFDWKPYVEFKNSKYGFTYMKDFIEDQFKFYDYEDALNVDSY